jgi:DNA-binding transcriptional ArsR family regulator
MRKSAILDVLIPKTRQGILAAVLVQPERAWYVSELARRLGVPSSSLQRELRALSVAGILKSHRQGRMVYYQANAESPVFPDLRGLLLKTAGLVDVLADVLRPLGGSIKYAFVYGSIASEEARSDSDIDLMIIGAVVPAALAVPLRKAREQLGREINPTIYAEAEFSAKVAAEDHFLVDVLTKPRLPVLGTLNDMGKAPRQKQRRQKPVKQGRAR